MDYLQIAMLLAGGVLGGIAASLAGGAAVFTFPALLASGVSPVSAVGTNMLALMPGVMLAAVFERKQLPKEGDFLLLVGAAFAGTSLGVYLLLMTPERLFQWLVPILLAFATVLFYYAEDFGRWLANRASPGGAAESAAPSWRRCIVPIVPVMTYGGYFGAGVGILVLGALAVGVQGDYRKANATKNLITSACSVVAITLFALNGKIAWSQGLVMMLGGLIGGHIGARIAMVAPKRVMRYVIVAIGVLLTVLFARRYWF
ncbi:MAG: hypothetical protein RLZ98_3684 [Pseudomonadota bacterium]|jgi:uncharacterized membrane protein YfcA